MRELTCVGCSEIFTAKSARAKWCSDACKKRVQRSGSVSASSDEPKADPEVTERHGLVAAVRRELEDAGKFDTVDGQMAMQLARRMVDPDESGIAALAKMLRASVTAAVGESKPAKSEPDEVARAREAREKARQAATGS